MKKRMTSDPADRQAPWRLPVFAFGAQENSKGMGMRRVAALAAGFAITLTAFGSFAAEPAQPATATASAQPAAPASAAKPAATKPDANPDALNMVPPPGPGVFSAQKKGAAGLHLTVTGHKFTSRAEIENYLAWQAAQQTEAQKATWFTFTEEHAKGDTVAAPKRDPKGAHYSFHMENWRPMWRYKMKGDTAWKSWSPFTGAAFFADGKDPKTVTDFEVSADITVHKGPMDDLNPLAFEAGPVSDLLINQVSPPQ
jgi:hypothetical protein